MIKILKSLLLYFQHVLQTHGCDSIKYKKRSLLFSFKCSGVLCIKSLYPVLQPVAIGKAIHPLRSLLQSEQLSQSVVLPVQKEGNSETWEFGPLKAIYFH